MAEMTKTPDDVVEKALKAGVESDGHNMSDLTPSELKRSIYITRAIGDVFVEWALDEAAAYMEKTLPHLSLQEYAAAIRALKDAPK